MDPKPELPGNLLNVLRRIRRCETEVPAQLALEHALRAAILADRERRGVPAGHVVVPVELLQRCIRGMDDLEKIARAWEPDNSSGSERQKWFWAVEAADEARALLAARPQVDQDADARSDGVLKVATDLLREALGPLEVSAAVIESEDGGAAMEAMIGRIHLFLKNFDETRAARSQEGDAK